LIDKFGAENEKIAKDIPVLKEVIEGTWRKEPELAALKAELTELDHKIQLSLNRQQAESIDVLAQSMPRRDGGKDHNSGLKPIGEIEEELINELVTEKSQTTVGDNPPSLQGTENFPLPDNRQSSPSNVNSSRQNSIQSSQGNSSTPQPHIPSRLREIADASGGRIVIAGVGSPPRKQDGPPNKGFKI
jgi:hypothetical protein